jgi:hypothetical protein
VEEGLSQGISNILERIITPIDCCIAFSVFLVTVNREGNQLTRKGQDGFLMFQVQDKDDGHNY